MKKFQTGLSLIVTTLLCLIAAPTARADAESADIRRDVLTILSIYDEYFVSSLHLRIRANYPTTLDPSQGRTRAMVEIVGNGEGLFLATRSEFRDPFNHRAEGSIGSLDEQGNYIQAYDSGISISLTAKDWRVRRDVAIESVASDNRVTTPAQQIAPRIELMGVGDPDAANLLYRYILPLGRGYSQHLDEITTISEINADTILVKATGTFFSHRQGEWTLQVNTSQGYLVQRAQFQEVGREELTFSADSNGYMPGAIPVYQNGSCAIAHYAINVQLLTYSLVPPPAFASQILGRTTYERISSDLASAELQKEFPDHSIIMDRRSTDSDGMPRILRVDRKRVPVGRPE